MNGSRIRRLRLFVAVAASLTLGIQLLAPGGAAQVSEAGGEGVEVLGHADPGGGFHADVVAHRGFAYLGSWGAGTSGAFCPSHGVRVFDLKDPSDPQHVATFANEADEPDVFGTWTEKVIVQTLKGRDIAAVSFQNCRAGAEIFRGWGLYDVTDPTEPQRLSLVAADPRTRGSHEIWLERRGNRAYVYTAIMEAERLTSPDGTTPGPDKDFQIWDVSDPAAPVRVGQWGAWEELGVQPRFTDEQGVSRLNRVHSVIGAVVGRQHRAYLSYWDLGTVILDVTDPATPAFLGRTEFAPHEEGNAHSAWLARGGNLLIQADEDFNPNPTAVLEGAWGYPRIFDVSDPANPLQLSTFELPTTRQTSPDRPGDFSVHDPKVLGNNVYFSWYAEGVVVADISDPAHPQQVAQFLPPPAEDPFGIFVPAQVNVWGVFVDRNYVLTSDMSSGLWVFRLDRSA